jgi:hypothetical protein
MADEKRSDQPPMGIIIALLVFSAVVMLCALAFGHKLSPIGRQMVVLVASASTAILMLYGTKYAAASGTVKGITFRFTGSGAIFVVTFFLLHYFMPKPDTVNVRIYLKHQQSDLLIPFRIRAKVRGAETVDKPAQNGETTVEVPSYLKELDLTVTCAGYRQVKPGPFQIDGGVVIVEMQKISAPPPLAPSELPPESIISDMPTRDQAKQSPAVSPDQVTLFYRNGTEAPLILLLFNVSRHYRIIDDKIDGGSAWQTFPIEPTDEFTAYNNFIEGSGWYCFVVRDADGKYHNLGCKNIFQKQNTRLTVRKSNAGVFTFELE